MVWWGHGWIVTPHTCINEAPAFILTETCSTFLLTFPMQEFRRRFPVQWNYRNIHWILKCAQWCLRAVSNRSGLSIGCSDMVYATSVVSPIHYCKHSLWCCHLSLINKAEECLSVSATLVYTNILYSNMPIPDFSVINNWVWILLNDI